MNSVEFCNFIFIFIMCLFFGWLLWMEICALWIERRHKQELERRKILTFNKRDWVTSTSIMLPFVYFYLSSLPIVYGNYLAGKNWILESIFFFGECHNCVGIKRMMACATLLIYFIKYILMFNNCRWLYTLIDRRRRAFIKCF